jgi:hypothetical protein
MRYFNKRYFKNLKYRPRQATDEELIDLAGYLLDKNYPLGSYGEPEALEAEQAVSESFISVCEDFNGQKIMIVVWSAGIDWYEILFWNEYSLLTPVKQNEEVEVEE